VQGFGQALATPIIWSMTLAGTFSISRSATEPQAIRRIGRTTISSWCKSRAKEDSFTETARRIDRQTSHRFSCSSFAILAGAGDPVGNGVFS
jgi:hypothetical protein